MRSMTKSPRLLARMAYDVGRAGLEPYSCKRSPRRYTQAQLFALLVLRQFFKTDYRGVVALVEDFAELRDVLELKRVPHYSTLCYAEQRLLRGGTFEALLAACIQKARQMDLLPSDRHGAIDGTGLETRHASTHYLARTGKRTQRYRRWPKVTIICETGTYLIAGLLVTRGPNNEARHFGRLVPSAHRLIGFETVVGDAAYDAEANHVLGRGLGIETVIPVNRRRSRGVVNGRYRQQMATDFPVQTYHRRSHIESVFSQHKRLLGSALRARSDASRSRECSLRVLTHNLMLLLLCRIVFSTEPIDIEMLLPHIRPAIRTAPSGTCHPSPADNGPRLDADYAVFSAVP